MESVSLLEHSVSENKSHILNFASDASPKIQDETTLLLKFSNDLATVRDKNGLSIIFKKYLKDLFSINEYIITIRNDDNLTYSYFLHELPVPDPEDEGFKTITGSKMPVEGSLTGAVLKSNEPVVFQISNILQYNTYSFPSYSFWNSVSAKEILGVRLKVANEDIGIFWIQPGKTPMGLIKGLSAQIAIALSNAMANTKIERQLEEIKNYKLKLEYENMYLHEQIETSHNYSEIIGSGQEMQKIFSLMSQVAFANSTVLILGATGTGKELIARAIHNNSPRKDKLMVKVNCAALPANLIESELFGHEKGSFTGATERRIGKFELANNSTLFLDEIGEMPLDLQVKLLRALQEKEIERVGGRTTIKVDVRIVAATNRDLEKEVQNGKFRSDLFYRLNVFPVHMPTLKDRKEDIPVLAYYFMHRFAKLSGRKMLKIADHAMRDLQEYSWPGNVRELEHLIERSVLLARTHIIEEVFLPNVFTKEIIKDHEDATIEDRGYVKTIDENERDHIIAVLKRCGGKIFGYKGAAELLGVPTSTLNSKISKLGIKKEQLFIQTKEK